MAEATQFTFSWAELAEILVKKQDIHEGTWMVSIEFVLNIGLMAVTPPNASPGVMVLGNSLQLVKAQEASPKNMVVDASVVNPKKSGNN